MCSSLRLFFFCPSVMYDLQNAGKHCQSWRRSPPRKMNPLAAAPDLQLVLTQLRMLAGINHFWCQLPGRIYHSIWKRITCRMEKDDEIWTTFFTFKRKFVHPRERWGAGNGFLPGLKCSAIVVLEDTWNYWWISTVESKWKKKKTRGCCRYKNRRLLYSTTWKMTVGEAIGGETRSVLVNPLIYKPVARARHRRRTETFEMWWMVTPCWTPSRFKL